MDVLRFYASVLEGSRYVNRLDLLLYISIAIQSLHTLSCVTLSLLLYKILSHIWKFPTITRQCTAIIEIGQALAE